MNRYMLTIPLLVGLGTAAHASDESSGQSTTRQAEMYAAEPMTGWVACSSWVTVQYHDDEMERTVCVRYAVCVASGDRENPWIVEDGCYGEDSMHEFVEIQDGVACSDWLELEYAGDDSRVGVCRKTRVCFDALVHEASIEEHGCHQSTLVEEDRSDAESVKFHDSPPKPGNPETHETSIATEALFGQSRSEDIGEFTNQPNRSTALGFDIDGTGEFCDLCPTFCQECWNSENEMACRFCDFCLAANCIQTMVADVRAERSQSPALGHEAGDALDEIQKVCSSWLQIIHNNGGEDDVGDRDDICLKIRACSDYRSPEIQWIEEGACDDGNDTSHAMEVLGAVACSDWGEFVYPDDSSLANTCVKTRVCVNSPLTEVMMEQSDCHPGTILEEIAADPLESTEGDGRSDGRSQMGTTQSNSNGSPAPVPGGHWVLETRTRMVWKKVDVWHYRCSRGWFTKKRWRRVQETYYVWVWVPYPVRDEVLRCIR